MAKKPAFPMAKAVAKFEGSPKDKAADKKGAMKMFGKKPGKK